MTEKEREKRRLHFLRLIHEDMDFEGLIEYLETSSRKAGRRWGIASKDLNWAIKEIKKELYKRYGLFEEGRYGPSCPGDVFIGNCD